MIGLVMPSSGTAFVQGLDIQTDMDEIYTSMGVCPQHEYVLISFHHHHDHHQTPVLQVEGHVICQKINS